MIQEGEGQWPDSSENLQKARFLWVLRTPPNNKKRKREREREGKSTLDA
jgi:hypothetical protein